MTHQVSMKIGKLHSPVRFTAKKVFVSEREAVTWIVVMGSCVDRQPAASGDVANGNSTLLCLLITS